ncbi:hypothetical protein [Alkalihalobacillus pseudalcaliphilus]|uniref:hypothetical protein n=1 Tax=Alkalihalobacillus pseudalcaliphilus TaxID=79884 RepID=UPI00064DD5EC|nr:hypothetical protein [Alkalihalobacillus pseudalcaliphilus]KMK75841.1 hypothetical protein AB990_11295 [Alkalihalobacillus pseudalcaliphilus]
MNKWMAFVSVIFILSVPTNVLANSSWQWLMGSPKEILLLAILFTLLVEIGFILIFLRNEQIKVISIVILVVSGANLLSFIGPYIFRTLSFMDFTRNWAEAWSYSFMSGPYYIILMGYLLLTIVIEVPLVYQFLKQQTKNEKGLLVILITINIITTLIVSIIERLIYQGSW